MTPRSRPALHALMLSALLLLVSGCASVPRPSLPPVIPALPAQATQPPAPALCLPTCSSGWKRLVESLLQSPTIAVSQDKPVKTPTGR